MTTMSERGWDLVELNKVFCPLAKISAVLWAMDLLLLGYTIVRHRANWSLCKREIMFLLVCNWVHMLDAKSFFHITEGTCTGAAVIWPIDVTATVLWLRLISIGFAIWYTKQDFKIVDREKNVYVSPAKETPRWLRLALTPRFESPWLRKTWALYFAGVYILFACISYGVSWKREVFWLGELIYSLWS
jgi:hypothetical protein